MKNLRFMPVCIHQHPPQTCEITTKMNNKINHLPNSDFEVNKKPDTAPWPFPIPPMTGVKVPAPNILAKAIQTMQNRAQERDAENGERSMAKTVAMFNAYRGYNLTESDGWAFMVFLKLARGVQGAYNEDDYVDGSAYFSLLGECESMLREHRKE